MNRCLAERAWLIRLAALLLCACGTGHSQTTTRVSVSSQGVQGNDHSNAFATSPGQFLQADMPPPAVSSNGRFIAFWSSASNLVPGDTLGFDDVFVHDRRTGTTTRASVATGGEQANGPSHYPAISGDGRYVVFQSGAANLAGAGAVGAIFLHDRQSAQTIPVSFGTDGVLEGGSFPSISMDARFVAYRSGNQIHVRDRLTATTRVASVNSSGTLGNDASFEPLLSADGRFVAFISAASNLVPEDTNETWDVFVHDLQTGATTRESVTSSGAQANGHSGGDFPPRYAAISPDGRLVAFWSSVDLVPGTVSGLYVRDREMGTTTHVSADCRQGSSLAFSGDGRFLTFSGRAWNQQIKSHLHDVYVADRLLNTITPISLAATGVEPDNSSVQGGLSANGRVVAFVSAASNLVIGDSNERRDVFARTLSPCLGDLNHNDGIDFVDLNLVLATYGLCGASALGDANGDGCVNFLDLNIVLGAFGTEC